MDNRFDFKVPSELSFGFTAAMRLMNAGEPGNTIPLDDWGIYADLTGNLAGLGYDLIARGTLDELKSLVASWLENPDLYWEHAFYYRQDAIARHKREYAQPFIPPYHPAYDPHRSLSVA